MVQLAGIYKAAEFVNPEVMVKVLLSEVTQEKINALKNTSITVEVIDNDNYRMISKMDDQVLQDVTFKLGKDFEENGGITNVTKDGNKFITTTKIANAVQKRTLEFSDSGAVMTYTTPSGETAKTTYKRL